MIYRMCLLCTQGACQSWCVPVQRRTDEKYQTGVTPSSSGATDCSRNKIVCSLLGQGTKPFATGLALVQQYAEMLVLYVRTSAQVEWPNDSRTPDESERSMGRGRDGPTRHCSDKPLNAFYAETSCGSSALSDFLGTVEMEENRNWKSWEGVYAVPDLKLEICPWCLRQRTDYFVVVYERDGKVESELVCNSCSKAGAHFIHMRKEGLSRKMALADFGFRTLNGRKPKAGAAELDLSTRTQEPKGRAMGRVEALIWTALWTKIDAGANDASEEELLNAVTPPDHPEYRLLPTYKYAVQRLSRRGWFNRIVDTAGAIRYSPARRRQEPS
jgi:hypothetical protein